MIDLDYINRRAIEASRSVGFVSNPEEAMYIDGVSPDIVLALVEELRAARAPIPMRLICPECKALHIDEGEFATKPHHTHSCQECGLTWRPAVVATVGVRFLPGFKG